MQIFDIATQGNISLLGDENSIKKLYVPSRLKRLGEEKILSKPHIVSFESTKKANSFGYKVEVCGWGEYIITPEELELYELAS